MHSTQRVAILCSLYVCVTGLSCSNARERIREQTEPPVEVILTDEDAGFERPDISVDPHAVLGVDPPQGPFSGGQLAVLRGNGFTSESQVWFGDQRVPSADVVSLDPNRISVTVPPGPVGSVDVTVQVNANADTRRTLRAGYRYEAFYVEPNSGPIQGGSRVTLTGQGLSWTQGTSVQIDLQPCRLTALRDLDEQLQELECVTPAGTVGSKVVRTRNAPLGNNASPVGDAAAVDPAAADAGTATEQPPWLSVTGAFTYVDESAAGFEGGFSGAPLTDELRVRVFDALLGKPLPGISVILGPGETPAQAALTDDAGSALLSSAEPNPTVTIAGRCIQPLSIVAVPSSELTLYAQPLLTPACIPPSLELPPLGGGGGLAPYRRVNGSLSWGTGVEFKQTTWINVPNPQSDAERQVAYVFELSDSARAVFSLPGSYDGVTTEERGPLGYPFEFETVSQANITLYALAGLEKRVGTQRTFTPYVMGLVKGVVPGDAAAHPVIPMNLVLDHRLRVDLENPTTNERGPDRVQFRVNLRLGRAGYVLLPQLERSTQLPVTDQVLFEGLPPLAQALSQAQYVLHATAVTGAGATAPLSDLESLATRNVSGALTVDDFIPTPLLLQPGTAEFWTNTTLEVQEPADSNFDLWSVRIVSLGEQLDWQVIAPRQALAYTLPDLRRFGATMPTGATRVFVTAARVPDFAYATLTQRSFKSSGWSAYAVDVFDVVTRLPDVSDASRTETEPAAEKRAP